MPGTCRRRLCSLHFPACVLGIKTGKSISVMALLATGTRGQENKHVTGSSSLADLSLPEDFLFVYACLFFFISSSNKSKQKQTNKNLSTAKIPNKQKKDYPVSLLEIKEQNSTCSGLTCMHYLACEFSRMRSQSPNRLHRWWTAWRILRSSHLEYMAGWWKLLQLRGWWPPWQGLHHINKLPCYGDEM